MIQNKDKETMLFWVLFSIIIIAAAYFRLVGLGTWGFSSSDEYYIAKTGQNILKFGLPQFETGGYYTRGILYEYLSVILLSLGLKDVLAYRLVSVIFNLLSVPALFLLIKKISNSKIALMSVTLFLFSVLEIEYSRLARFYTAFQAFFLWYIYFLYSVIIENKLSDKKWLYIISFTSIFVYEGAIFIVVLNFLIFIYHNKKIKITDVVNSAFILLFALFFLKTDFRNIGVENYLPLDISFDKSSTSQSVINFPKILLTTIKLYPLWIFLFLAPLAFSIYSSVKIKADNLVFKFGLFLIIVLSLLNQFGLVFYISLLLVLTPYFNKEFLSSKHAKLFVAAIIFNFIFWFAYCFFTLDWIAFYPEVNSFSVKRVAWLFFNYPNIYESLLLPWLQPLPKQTILTFVIIISFLIMLLIKGIEKEENKGYKLLLVVLILMGLGISAVVTPYNYARYSFFVYPLVLSLIPISIYFVTNSFNVKEQFRFSIIILAVVIYLFVSEDFKANHIINIDSKEINFKDGFNKKQSGMYYYREDYETAANVINKNLGKDDIVITMQETIDYYLNRLDYFFKPYNDLEFSGRSRNEGRTEIWSNAKLIYTEEKLRSVLESRNKTVWLIDFSNNRHYVSELEQELNSKYSKYLFYENLNNTINVFKLPPTKENNYK